MSDWFYHNVILDPKYEYWEYEYGHLVIFDISTISALITKDHEIKIRKATNDEHQKIFEIMNGIKPKY